MCQYFVYQIKKAQIENVLNKTELLCICVAALAHDAGHQGLNNVYNINAETPLGILFKDTSVMETYHCTVIISIMQREECNIFRSFDRVELKKIWRWIISMILATDMQHHFRLIQQANDILDEGPINLESETHRLMAMTMLMKVSDISNVSRPFKVADKWCDVLSEEFWRQGDLEHEQGLPYSSNLTDRANCDKPKGQIDFYTFVCKPLYVAIARIFPELTVNLESMMHNLEIWKELQKKEAEERESKRKAAEEAKAALEAT